MRKIRLAMLSGLDLALPAGPGVAQADVPVWLPCTKAGRWLSGSGHINGVQVERVS